MNNNTYEWTDNPTVSGLSVCDTDVLNECLMHLKYQQNGSGLTMFDIVQKDHVLSYEETKGLAGLGSYVYKNSVAEFRYGYPEFYEKCISEMQSGEENVATLCGRQITLFANSNGHVYYNIEDKDVVDEFYATYGAAWYYGVDEENERIFLPRNNWFFQSCNGSDAGGFVEAGLPNITASWNISSEFAWTMDATGAAILSAVSGTRTANATGGNRTLLGFDASRSNGVYGKSNTVQPNAVKVVYYMVVGNTGSVQTTTVNLTSQDAVAPLGFDNQTGALTLNINNGLTVDGDGNLSVSADKLEQSGISTVVETYENNGSWYRVWSDGWIEQGGYAVTSTAGWTYVTYLKPFRGSIPPILSKVSYDTSSWTVMAWDISATGFTAKVNLTGYEIGMPWYAAGYME